MEKFHSHQEVVSRGIASDAAEELRGRLRWIDDEIEHLNEYRDRYDSNEGIERLVVLKANINNAIRNLESLANL